MLFQLVIVIGFLAAVWFSFGQNVLTPQTPSGVPKRLGDLELVSNIGGPEALAQVSRLHGTNIELVSASIAGYAHISPYHGNSQATVWVGTAESTDAAVELLKRMREAIEKGGAPFSNLRQLTIADHEVFRIDGPGGEHFFFNSENMRERVVWLTVEAGNTLAILEQVLENF